MSVLGNLLRRIIRRQHDSVSAATTPSKSDGDARPSTELQEPAVVSVAKVEKKSGELESKLANMEGRIDPLRAMVEQMRNEDFWK